MKKLIVAVMVGGLFLLATGVIIGAPISVELKGPAGPTIGQRVIPEFLNCYEGQVIEITVLGAGCWTSGIPVQDSSATIAGQRVPELHCQEDELIGFHGIPDEISCVHIDWLRDNLLGGQVR